MAVDGESSDDPRVVSLHDGSARAAARDGFVRCPCRMRPCLLHDGDLATLMISELPSGFEHLGMRRMVLQAAVFDAKWWSE